MRICHVAPELLPVPPTRGGAIERWVRDAAVRLARRGHEMHVVSRDAGDGPASRTDDGVCYHYVPIPAALDRGFPAAFLRGAWYYWRARRVLRGIAPDIVHHHSRPAGLWLAAGAAPGARHVISLHSMDYGWGFGYRGWDRPFFARGFARASCVLAVSRFIERHAAERYPELRGKVTTLYNGVDGDVFRPEDERRGLGDALRAPGDEPGAPGGQGRATSQVILYVGRIESRKGVKLLVDAFEQRIAREFPGATLRLVGPHSYWDAQPSAYYRELAERCAANPRVELRGPTYDDAELAAVYRDAAVAVVPSTFPEALGLTSIEAQASGTPVVVSDAGGLPETVAPGESGLVFESGNAGALADAVASVLSSSARREAMSVAARRWAMVTFSWDAIAGELERAYAEAGHP